MSTRNNNVLQLCHIEIEIKQTIEVTISRKRLKLLLYLYFIREICEF